MKNNIKSLLITGNGLDLNSKLQSSYKNFFKNNNKILNDLYYLEKIYINIFELVDGVVQDDDSIFEFEDDLKRNYYSLYCLIEWTLGNPKDLESVKIIEPFLDTISKVINGEDYSYWLLPGVMGNSIFHNWNDIESFIGEYLNDINNHNPGIVLALEQLKNSLSIKCLEYKCKPIDFNLFMIIAGCLNKIDKEKKSSKEDLYEAINKIDINEFLYSELKKLEDNFASYLKYEVEREEYKYNVVENISKIAGEDDVNILNFNYTNYKEYINEYRNKIALNVNKVINIHGNLDVDSHIIFGIDNKFGKEDSKKHPINIPMFTKTYRIMSISSVNSDDIRDLLNSKDNDPYEKIKFFGHSLSDADYSYFQSIFDNINLYSSDVILEFYYSKHTDDENYDEIDLHKAENDVFRLLDVYGQTLDNKDHGRNLLHKLLLEGRLVIKELE